MRLKIDLQTPFRVLLDDADVARLMELADILHAKPTEIIAAIVHDVLEDDALAHQTGGAQHDRRH